MRNDVLRFIEILQEESTQMPDRIKLLAAINRALGRLNKETADRIMAELKERNRP